MSVPTLRTNLKPIQEFLNLAIETGQLGQVENIVSRARTSTSDTKLEIIFSVWIDDLDFNKFAEILIKMNEQMMDS